MARAFIWPDQVDDLAALRGAVELLLSTPAITLMQGEATADPARLLAALPGQEPVVVFAASLLSYLATDARAAFFAQLTAAAASRQVAWVLAENPALLATIDLDVAALTAPLSRDSVHYAVGVSMRGPGHREDRLLALAEPYFRWIAPARHPMDDFQWVQNDAECIIR